MKEETNVAQAREAADKAWQEFVELKAKKERLEQPITLQDIVIGAQHSNFGFVGRGEYVGTRITSISEEDTEKHKEALKNLPITINQLATFTKAIHERNLQEAEIQKQEKGNCITRLTTTEFFFYTKDPLDIDEFQNLMNQVNNIAKEQPSNMHLVLSSFAVEHFKPNTTDEGILSVVSYVECGPNPQMRFIAKNKPSRLDPPYVDEDGQQLDTWGMNECTQLPTISIDGRECPFSYDNVLKCKTAANAEFYAGVNICKDHEESGPDMQARREDPEPSSSDEEQSSEQQQQQRSQQQEQQPQQQEQPPQEYAPNVANKNMKKIEDSAQGNKQLYPIQKWLIITSNSVSAHVGICWPKTTYADRLSESKKEPINGKMRDCTGPHLQTNSKQFNEELPFPNISASDRKYFFKIYQRDQCSIIETLQNNNQILLTNLKNAAARAGKALSIEKSKDSPTKSASLSSSETSSPTFLRSLDIHKKQSSTQPFLSSSRETSQSSNPASSSPSSISSNSSTSNNSSEANCTTGRIGYILNRAHG